MKYRKIDKLGRLYIPGEFQQKYEVQPGRAMELTIEYGKICIKPFNWEDIKERPSIGIVRYVDNIGRICIPREFLSILEFSRNTQYLVEYEDEKIIIQEI